MSDERVFLPEPEPDSGVAPAPALPHDPPEYPPPAPAPPPAYRPYERPGLASSQAAEALAARGPSDSANHYGHTAIALGSLTVALVLILYFVGGGIWWLYVGLGAAAVYNGVKGVRAASGGFATNGRLALTGAILGLIGAVAAAAYLVIAAFVLAAAFSALGA